MDGLSGQSFLYHLLANELSVVLHGELDKAIENMAPLPPPKERKHMEHVAAIQLVPKTHAESDLIFSKLEAMGYQVGLRLIERITKEHSRFREELEIMKFICTDFWKYIYEKQIDTLRTNNQGTYVLTDNLFKPLTFFGSDGVDQYYPITARFIAYPCGLIRGALSAMGVRSTVSAKTTSMTSCVFEIIVERT